VVAEEKTGTWGHARVLSGPASLGPYADAEIVSVSCATARNCSAGGDFYNRQGHIRPFVAVSGTETGAKCVRCAAPAL
jgi:hypothetical protein